MRDTLCPLTTQSGYSSKANILLSASDKLIAFTSIRFQEMSILQFELILLEDSSG